MERRAPLGSARGWGSQMAELTSKAGYKQTSKAHEETKGMLGRQKEEFP